jgi:hypothetical protein
MEKIHHEINGDKYTIVVQFHDANYVDFEVYKYSDMEEFIDDYEPHLSDFIFSCWLSYKHCFPYFGDTKESGCKYHYQFCDEPHMRQQLLLFCDLVKMIRDKFDIGPYAKV